MTVRRAALAIGVGALVAACSWASPPELPSELLGCYALQLRGWTDEHTSRLGMTLPRQVRLDSTRVEGGRRLLLPQQRDWSVSWGHSLADSLSLSFDAPNFGLQLLLPAEGADHWGEGVWWPRGYDEALAPVRARLVASSC